MTASSPRLPRLAVLTAALRQERLQLIADAIEARTGQRPEHITVTWSRGSESGLPVIDLITADNRPLEDGDYAWEIPEPAYQHLLAILEEDVDDSEGGEMPLTIGAEQALAS